MGKESKRRRQLWDASNMQRALHAVQHQNMPLNSAAKKFSVPRNTLKRRATGKNKVAINSIKFAGGRQVRPLLGKLIY